MKSISKKNILSTENGVKSKKYAIGLRKSLKNWEPFSYIAFQITKNNSLQ